MTTTFSHQFEKRDDETTPVKAPPRSERRRHPRPDSTVAEIHEELVEFIKANRLKQ